MAKGFAAVTHDGNILVDTVSLTDRAAMVHWLVIHSDSMVPHGAETLTIREHFSMRAKDLNVTIQRVNITFDE